MIDPTMRILCTYRGKEKAWETSEKEVIIGRADESGGILLDLAPDQKVSRLHGRIWEEDGRHWIEDLNSSRGTKLNGVDIKRQGKQQLQPGDTILAGETTLRIEFFDAQAALLKTNYLEQGRILAPEKSSKETNVAIAHDVDATVFDAVSADGNSEETARRLRVVCDLPLQFAAKTQLESLLPAIVDQVVALIPSGESWALLLLEPGTNALLLKAYHYERQPYLSETLARRAIKDRKAFIWKRNMEGDISGSIVENAIESGMYAPLVWQGEALGVICAGARNVKITFREEDLRLLVVVAQYAAMAVASYRLQDELRRESVAKANLLRQFSPKVAEQLLAHRGRLRLGGQRSEVTILNSDIRGFTQLARDMDPDDVVEMLNEYFSVLVPVIFAHGGTIDKFMGDAILAVWGSPEPDPKQHEHAIRAGVDMQAAVAKLNELRKVRNVPCRDFGIGIHCGEVVHGFVGTADRMEFTVISDAVNRAARYCAAAEGGEVLISPEVHERVWQIVETVRKKIQTKHEGEFDAYCVTCCKPGPSKAAKESEAKQ
ncbi:MAG: adenylate/guanylate cyclase domain-containing protein [Candidatus Acidiferrales bacterium]